MIMYTNEDVRVLVFNKGGDPRCDQQRVRLRADK